LFFCQARGEIYQDYAAAGLRKTIPFSARLPTTACRRRDTPRKVAKPRFLPDGLTTSAIWNSAPLATYKISARCLRRQGYDAALLLAVGLDAVKGDMSKRKEMITAMERAKIDSPRGSWTMSKAHNPIQDIYLRKVVGRENKFVSVAHKALADPARGCKM
jgi:branched-chain amino acid transport system substrate-binding protein